MTSAHEATPSPALPQRWPGAAVWAAAWLAMLLFDAHMDLANLAMVLILAATLAAVWLPLLASMLACAAAVLAFNFAFVPPRGRLSVDVGQHALLLVTMLAVSWIVALLMARQRQLAAAERMHALRAEQLQSLGESLRDAEDPRSRGPQLRAALASLAGSQATLLMAAQGAPDEADPASFTTLGDTTADERAGLWLCLRQTQAMGPGTGRHEEQPAWYLPMRGRRSSFGAALLPLPELPADADTRRVHAQALCDQMGLAIERAMATQAAAAAREEAHGQKLRNTLLAAISHDYRTPLATILGAATSLHDQADRLSAEQRRRLASTIADEAGQLARLTDNTLQLARLDTRGLALHLDWESPEEIVGTAMRRVRQRDAAHKVKARLEPGLPLLRCDAVLLVQLLDNLIDNAFKYGGDAGQVEIVVRRIAERVVLAVRDRGPGVALAWRERIFDVFQRAEAATGSLQPADAPPLRGAGVGLAVCRAIARAHGGELTLRARGHGGSSFECALPVQEPPAPINTLNEEPRP
jgi:two-component system sensor histidine kinase KdpD